MKGKLNKTGHTSKKAIKVVKAAGLGLFICMFIMTGLTACGGNDGGADTDHPDPISANTGADDSTGPNDGQNSGDPGPESTGANLDNDNTNSADINSSGNPEAGSLMAGPDGRSPESAQDGIIDFVMLAEYNPDIFAWLYVPGTNIDLPILQSGVADDYYADHLADGTEGAAGAPYTEMANLMNMCDFNTIIHGHEQAEDGLFYQLHRFEDPDFFAANDVFHIYLPDNVLTYRIVTAYYDGDSDILRRFDYTTTAGCQSYLEQMLGARDIGRNLREGADQLTPYHFLVTLNGDTNSDTQSQYVVIGLLVDDQAGTITRTMFD